MSFLDSDSSEGEGRPARKTRKQLDLDGQDDGDRLRVNEKFAKSFEKRKREQELQAAKHLDVGDEEGDSESSSESETEDEDAEMLTPALDLQIMKTINRIRSKDTEIYDSTKEWFGDADKEGPSGPKKSKKRMRYKDVVREQIMQADTAEDAISSDEDSDDDVNYRGGASNGGSKGLAYDEEQEKLRKSLLGSIAEHEGAGGSGSDSDDDDGDGLLKVREKTAADVAEEEEELRREAEKMQAAGDGGEEDEFLRDFVANRRWLDPTSKETPSYDEILNAPHVKDSEDEVEIDRADQFESKYNFRFEGEGGGEIAMHSRNVPGSMRRKDDKRKRERDNRKARKTEERARKEAELRRLKNIKRDEIRRRLQAIQEMSGGALVDQGLSFGVHGDEEGEDGDGIGAAEVLVEGDFDPDKWDAVTRKAFGDSYYEAQDADDSWKPGDNPLEGLGDLERYNDNDADDDGYHDADEQGHANGTPNGSTLANGHNGVKTAVPVETGGRDEEREFPGDEGWAGDDEEGWEEDEEGWEEGDEEEVEGVGVGAEKERLLDELYKLDYEDIIGDIPCRFKYTRVKANDFGLAPEEILLADDKDLNKYVPLKKLAPYRTDEPTLDARRRRHLREEVKAREAAAEAEMAVIRASKKKRGRKKKAPAATWASGGVLDVGKGGEIGDVSTTMAITPAITEELAGGKRRRRKKGQKKQRAKGDGSGGAGGEQEADMVPRVEPMASSPVPDEDRVEGLDSNNIGRPGSGKKWGKKRGRESADKAGTEAQEGQGAEQDNAGRVDPSATETTAASVRIGDGGTSRKKTGRGKGGKRGGEHGMDVGENGKTKAKKRGGGAAHLAAVSGVSKSRLASYGL